MGPETTSKSPPTPTHRRRRPSRRPGTRHAPHVTVIKPPGRWGVLEPRELWRYRELLYFLVWRDLKVRYKQTAFGGAWAVIQPFADDGRLLDRASAG